MSKAPPHKLVLIIVAACITLWVDQCYAAGREIDPSVNFCHAIDGLAAGDELVLKPGEYAGGCKIRRSGEPTRPSVIRAADLKQRPRIVYQGRGGNALEIHASHIRI